MTKKQIEIKQNIKKSGEITNIKKIFVLLIFFLKWAGPGPDQWVGPDPAQNQMGWLLCTHSNQPPHHLLQNVNYSCSACKCRQGWARRNKTGQQEVTWGGIEAVLLTAAVLLSRWRDCGGRQSFSFLFLSLLCFFFFFFLSVFKPFSLLLFFSLFFCSFGPLPSSFLFSFFFVLSALSLLPSSSLLLLFFLCFFFSLSLSFLFFLPPSPFFVSPFSPLLIGEKRRSTPLPSQWCRGVG